MPGRPIDPLARTEPWDAIVIGGGFFGCSIATTLRTEFGHGSVLVIEREADILARASYRNQARVHNGYHYPRSFTTAFRSRVNFRRFSERYADCVDGDLLKLYAIAAHNSRVTPRQFEKFCDEIGAPYKPAPDPVRRLFNARRIAAVYEVTEFTFDARRLASRMREDLEAAGVRLLLGARVVDVSPTPEGPILRVALGQETAAPRARRVFNCTYAGLNHIGSARALRKSPLKHELAELALVEVPPQFRNLGVTVMDGPFFSCMPFPSTPYHSLSHVRYTPHLAWRDRDQPARHPYDVLDGYAKRSLARYMIADAARYLPLMAEARHERSLFEIKTVLLSNEVDDGRPILFEAHGELPGAYSVLGGKIDNIFDIEEAMRSTLETTDCLPGRVFRHAAG